MRCGIDAVEIERCVGLLANPRWLERIFTPTERAYILASPTHSLERIAGRFAAKEAIFKALSPAITVPFFTFCQSCQVVPGSHGPIVELSGLLRHLSTQKIALSITHTRESAFACAIVPTID